MSAVAPHAESQVHLSRQAQFRAWVGRRERLVRFEAELVRVLEKERQRRVADIRHEDDDIGGIRARIEAERITSGLTLEVEVTAAKGRLKRKGSIGAILDEMDLAEIETIRMSNGGYFLAERDYPQVLVELGKSPTWPIAEKPVRVEVAGPDRQWVGGVFDFLVGEIRKDVPWWAVLRAFPAGIVIALVLGLGFFGWRYAVSPGWQQHDAHVVANFLLAVMFVAFWIGLLVFRPLLLRIFPAVEVVEAGVNPRGRQALAALVTIVSFGMGLAGLVLAIAAV